jgi:hypothetical protein
MDEKRIASFLARGLKPSQVAAIVGCTPAYITQLGQKETFKALLDEVQAEAEGQDGELAEEEILATKYLAVEHKILKQIEDTMPFAEFTHLTKALEVVGKRQEERAKRKMMSRLPGLAGPAGSLTVSLTVPIHAIPEYTINPQGQITSINEKVLAPLSSQGVKDLFDKLQGRAAPGPGADLEPLDEVIIDG